MSKEVIKIEKEVESLKDCRLAPAGLEIKSGLQFEAWEKIGESLGKLNRAVQWWWGDWLNYGEREYGEMYSEALNASPYEYETLRVLKSVCSRVELLSRDNNLSFNHHKVVASLETGKQKEWLKKARESNWTTEELRRAIKTGKEVCEHEEEEVRKCKKCHKVIRN